MKTSNRSVAARSVLSVDVEDWFHILDVPSAPLIDEWSVLPSRIERNFVNLLDLFSEKNIRVTCFFLSWIAQRYPHLVKEASQRGHEVASHGHSHSLTYELSEDKFYNDVLKSKGILEDLVGQSVWGYRSPGFSAVKEVSWFFDKLIEAGYIYDSSVFPALRGHGGMKTDQIGPHIVKRKSGSIIEIPISISKLLGTRLCLFGGGYFRISPYPLIKWTAGRVLADGRPVVFYVHPREIDPSHPRLPMNLKRKFKSYVMLGTTEQKLNRVLEDFDFATFEELIHERGLMESP